MSEIPETLSYTKEHEWLVEDAGAYKVGITSVAVEQLGDVTMVELPEVGDGVTKDEVFGTVESVKAVSDLYAPISGTVAAINEALDDSPELVNESCYGGGWLIRITASDESELDSLMSPADYAEFTKED